MNPLTFKLTVQLNLSKTFIVFCVLRITCVSLELIAQAGQMDSPRKLNLRENSALICFSHLWPGGVVGVSGGGKTMSKTGFNHSSTSSLTCCEEIRRWSRAQRCIATCTNNFTLIPSCSQPDSIYSVLQYCSGQLKLVHFIKMNSSLEIVENH